jgi:guanine deaminase
VLNPRPEGGVDYWPDGVILGDAVGRIVAAGPWAEVAHRHAVGAETCRQGLGIFMPPLLDAHIHIPQHPIRGRFPEGVEADPPGGRLLASLQQNVFPAEGRCKSPAHARHTPGTWSPPSATTRSPTA